ncbi:MAG: hypothetical protein ACK5M3_10505 [Dysgonomonas sp.]
MKTINGDLDLTKEQITEYIKTIHIQNGYELVDNEDNANKSVIITSADNSPWISVYDEETESQEIEILDQLTNNLSKELDTIALGLLVSDSDYIYIGLNKSGMLLDSISNLDNLTSLTKKEPEAWEEIISGNAFEHIQTIWDNKTVFIESFLAEFSKLADLDQQHISMGYNYWAQEYPNIGTKLHFAKNIQEKDNTEQEGTSLNILAREGDLNFSSDSPPKIKWLISNSGKSSVGLEIMVTGNSIENQLLEPLSATIKQSKQTENTKEYKVTFQETMTDIEEKLFFSKIEDFYFPEGIRPVKSKNHVKMGNYYQALYDSAIAIELEFSGLKASEGELKLFICPLENRDNGWCYDCIPVSIHST